MLALAWVILGKEALLIIEYSESIHDDFYEVVKDITIRMREKDYQELSALTENPTPRHFSDMAMIYPGQKYIVTHNGKGQVVGGISQWYSGVGVLWLWATEEFDKCAKSATRCAQKAIKQFFDNGGHRIECTSMATHSNIHRWLELLGLELEHVKKSCGKNKEDFYIYSKVI